MLKRATNFLLGEQVVSNQAEIARQNRLAIRYLAVGGLPIAAANVVAQLLIVGQEAGDLHDVALLLYFGILILLDRLVIPQECPHATLVTYLVEAPIMLITILLGTIWDPTHDAITIFLFMSVLPVFLLDRPIRVIGVSTFWTLLFLALCRAYKMPELWVHDLVHALEFYLSSMAVSLVVLKLRFEVVENLALTHYHLVHDPLTDTYNHVGLDERAKDYMGKPLFVALGDINHLTIINDSYGNEAGNQVLVACSEVLGSVFGTENLYRLGRDELLCIGEGLSNQEGIERLEACHEGLSHIKIPGLGVNVSISFGYVTGTPRDDETFKDMVHLANIYSHQTRSRRGSTSVGRPFSLEALDEGVRTSAMATRAHSYEINQLTGLPTMAFFINRVEETLSLQATPSQPMVVGYFKISHFREFNDRNGYAKGDEILRILAGLLKDALPNRHVAYLSGSRFVALCLRREVDPAMEFLTSSLARRAPEHELQLLAGFALYHKGDSVISLIDHAKLAHDNVAPTSTSGYRFYDAELDREIRLRMHLVSHIDRAIELNWLLIHYQPIIDSTTGKVCAFEALSRWNDPIYGLLPPNQFIGVLEDESVIYKLSKNVVRHVLLDLKKIQMLGLPLIPISVNLSRKDFFECDMVEEITTMVDSAGLPRSILAIEITESAFVESTDLIKREVGRLRQRGFAVWMDDFGSEYSTLNLLQELEFDLVKVDMRFMRNFSFATKNATIVSSIINMCGQLGLTTLVEGVEEREQYDALRHMGADRLQGYLFSPPRPLADLIGNARSNGWM